MSIKGLSFKEICAIIKSCKDNGVASLKFCGLDVTFDTRVQSPETYQNEYIPSTKITDPVTSIVETDAELEEYRRAQEIVTDPEAHEAFMIDQASQE